MLLTFFNDFDIGPKSKSMILGFCDFQDYFFEHEVSIRGCPDLGGGKQGGF